MLESCGGNFHEGSYRSNGFYLIQEYFQQRTCKHCCRNYAAEGIELVREEPGLLVVKVACLYCRQPLGIALVGVNGNAKVNALRSDALSEASGSMPRDWSKGDVKRLSGLSRITYNDVLDAHEFFSSLDADWQKHLPKKGRVARRQDAC